MNYKLIMLDNPILVSDEEIKEGDWCLSTDEYFVIKMVNSAFSCDRKIIAGLPDLPKLDLSLIAEEIGCVDVEKLAYNHLISIKDNTLNTSWEHYTKNIFIQGFKAAQSLNEKKYSEEDMYGLLKLIGKKGYYVEIDGRVYANAFSGGIEVDVVDGFIQSLSKPKEYLIEVEMEQVDIEIEKSELFQDYESYNLIPKITNNTIKVTKLL